MHERDLSLQFILLIAREHPKQWLQQSPNASTQIDNKVLILLEDAIRYRD